MHPWNNHSEDRKPVPKDEHHLESMSVPTRMSACLFVYEWKIIWEMEGDSSEVQGPRDFIWDLTQVLSTAWDEDPPSGKWEAGVQGESEVCFSVLLSPICTDRLLFSVWVSVRDRPKSSLSMHASECCYCIVFFPVISVDLYTIPYPEIF